jgi:hypothetical protein
LRKTAAEETEKRKRREERRDARGKGKERQTHRSVTISKIAPNLLLCPNALAAIPSTASRSAETQYATVQNLGCVGMYVSAAAPRRTRV